MAEVIFNYEGSNTSIQCNINDKMSYIIGKFLTKIEKKENEIYCLYNGNKINSGLTFNEQANDLDKNRLKMNVIVYSTNYEPDPIDEIISKDIICPKCKENYLIELTRLKFDFHGCKNNHKESNILLDQYEDTQKIDLCKIICDICNMNNKSITHNKEFFICNSCNKRLCPLCKSIHDKTHIIINYDDINYICKNHSEPFTKYCKTCNKDICIQCENEHNQHDIFDFSKILIDKDELLKTNREFKNSIDILKYKINIIKELSNRTLNLLDLYYKINDTIINNYNIKKRNYYQLQNLNGQKNKLEKFTEEIKITINNNNLSQIIEFSIDKFYNEDGEKYIGEKKNNLKNGKGILFFNLDDQSNRKRYEGNFKDNKAEGKGVFYFKNGDRYEGDFIENEREGKGVYFWNNGDRFEGEYKNDKKEGKGIIYYSNGDKFEGIFSEDTREGYGKYFWNNGDRYIGDYKNDKKEGKGMLIYNNGDRFEGIFKNDKKDGEGVLYFFNGDRYEGKYINDKVGKGIIFYYKGGKYEGEFNNYKKEGKGIMYYKDGKIEKGNWINDKKKEKGF